MVQAPKTILVVDDSAAIRRELCDEFMRRGFAVCVEAEDGRQAIESARDCLPDLVILDLAMPVMNGIEAAARIREILPLAPIILYTAFADAIATASLEARGVTAVFPKTDPLDHLMARAAELLHV
jgi:two-component system, response regulator PdtaR